MSNPVISLRRAIKSGYLNSHCKYPLCWLHFLKYCHQIFRQHTAVWLFIELRVAFQTPYLLKVLLRWFFRLIHHRLLNSLKGSSRWTKCEPEEMSNTETKQNTLFSLFSPWIADCRDFILDTRPGHFLWWQLRVVGLKLYTLCFHIHCTECIDRLGGTASNSPNYVVIFSFTFVPPVPLVPCAVACWQNTSPINYRHDIDLTENCF